MYPCIDFQWQASYLKSFIRLSSLSPSETFAMAQKSNELKSNGVDVINMSVGEPDFNISNHIKQAAKCAIDDNFSFYSPIPGLNINNPMGAFYIFPECKSYLGRVYNGKTIETATDLAMYLLEEAHMATVGGDALGAPGCIRLSYATSDENIEKAVVRIKDALGKLS